MSVHNIPRLFRYLFLVAVVNVAVFSLFRIGFWIYFSSPTDPLTTTTIANAFFIGFKYDIRLALLMVLPMLLLAWPRLLSPLTGESRGGKRQRLWLAYLIITFALVLVFYITHFAYYAYLHVPLDATILRFFENPGTSLLMVWQTYPVIWLILAWLFIAIIYGLAVKKIMAHVMQQPMLVIKKRYQFFVNTVCIFTVLFGLYGKLSWYPLRWSDAFFSTHAFASAMTVNPVIHSYATLKNKDVQFDIEATSQHYERMASYLGVDGPDKTTLNYKRTGKPNKINEGIKQLGGDIQPNVVIVILESFASYKTSLSGNALDPTPEFAAIANDGIYFKNFYVPHTGTARSVWTTVTGLADVETTRTSTRNPLIVNQHTLINTFDDYKKLYFIGGSASWGNIRGLLSYNIPGLKLYEEGSYTLPRVDVWGISDIDLFIEANQVLKQEAEPFFAIIQTSGNHRPYTIPDDNHGFKILNVKKKDIFKYGFHSVDEYNAFRFMDHSIAVFMEAAKQEPYFENTIFVFYGDHGIHANTGEHTPKYEEMLGIQGLRVPLVIYSPKLLPTAQVKTTIASEVDVLATIAGTVADSYINTSMGRDLLDEQFDNARYAFTVTHSQGVRIGVIDEDYYFLMNSDGANKVLHQLSADDPRKNIMNQNVDKTQELEELAAAMFETTRYMRFHNERIEQSQ